MPATTRYWSDNPQDRADNSLKEAAEAERRNRAALYKWACAQYDGDHRRFLKVREGIVDPNVIINRDGQAIDARLNFFFPDELFTLQLDEDSQASDTEKQVMDILEDNGGTSFLQDCGLYGEFTGHVFVRIYPPMTEEGDPDTDIRLKAMNPAQVIVYWLAHDKDCTAWYEQRYTADRQYKIDYVNWDAMPEYGLTGWEILTYYMQQNNWILLTREKWPYMHPPMVDWQHLRDPRNRYGRTALSAAKINDSLNKTASDIKQILRYHAAPKVIGKGLNPSDVVSTGIDNFFTIPADTPEAKHDVKHLEMQSDLASSMNFLSYLDAAHSADMKVVRVQGGADAFKGITNLGLKVAFADMLAEASRVHRNYTVGLREIICTILEMLGMDTENIKPKITWPAALPMSELEATQTAQMQMDMGILSKESAATDLNIDWQQEQERLASEGADAQAIADAAGQLAGQIAAGQMAPQNGNGGMALNARNVQ